MSSRSSSSSSIDSSRYFPIPSSLDDLSKKDSCWTNEETYELAMTLFQKCQSNNDNNNDNNKNYGSIYVGNLGPMVYLRYVLAKHHHYFFKKDPQQRRRRLTLLEEARQHAQHAVLYQETKQSQQSQQQQRVSLLEGKWVGAKCLLAAILHQLGQDSVVAKQHAQSVIDELTRLCSRSRLSSSECEVLYGRSGALQAIWFLRCELDDVTLGHDFVVKTSIRILEQGMKLAKQQNQQQTKEQDETSNKPLFVWAWHGKTYLGAAHGIVGILHTLLYLTDQEWQKVEQAIPSAKAMVRSTIDSLHENKNKDSCFCHSSGNLRSSLESHNRGQDRLVHWCHGAPGHCLLLARASTVFQDATYLQRAIQLASTVVWPRGCLKKGVGLCHGIAGNAYVFLTLARHIQQSSNSSATTSNSANQQSEEWRQKAVYYAKFAIQNLNRLERIPDRPYSLYEGLSGLVCLLLELNNPIRARFPLYEY